jgi:voltage-gated potassium channel
MGKEKPSDWSSQLYTIIFKSDTKLGKAFDIWLIVFIVSSSLLVMVYSVESIREAYGHYMNILEWVFISAFSAEYILRILCSRGRTRYATSFFGIIDLMAILPAFLKFFIPSTNFLIIVRVFRLLRLFRILKMVRYVEESGVLMRAMAASKPKIVVFLLAIFTIITTVGSLMYVIEGPENGFSSIPESMYWAVVTVSTVGYGDISPHTIFGKFLASILMVVAYGILAVPTGIITYELAQTTKRSEPKQVCPECNFGKLDKDASFCSKCGTKL